MTPDTAADTREPPAVHGMLPTHAPAVPRLPRLLPGLAKLTLADAYLVEGAAQNQVFRGRAATVLLPRLVEALDGTRDVARLAEHLQVPEGHIRTAVALLHTRGLLEEGADPPAPADPVAWWLGRALGTTRQHRSTAAVLARLADARVGILGDPGLGTRLLHHLHGLGVQAELSPSESVPDGNRMALVVAVAAAPEPVPWFASVDAQWRRRAPWLRVLLDGSVIEIGPRFDARVSPEYRLWQETRLPNPSGGEGSPFTDAALSVAATEVLHLVAGIGSPQTLHSRLRFDLARWETQQLPVTLPPCPVGTGKAGTPQRVSAAGAFEHLARPWPDELDPGAARAQKRASGERQWKKGYFAHHREALPDSVPACPPALNEPVPDTYRLSAVLRSVRGRAEADGPVPRASTEDVAASPHCYLITLGASSRSAGVRYYDADEHTLVTLREFTPEKVCRARQALGTAEDVLVVLTGEISHVRPGVLAPALRTGMIDAGAAVHRIARTATSVGWRAALSEQAPFLRVSRLLGMDPAREPVLAVVGLAGTEQPSVSMAPGGSTRDLSGGADAADGADEWAERPVEPDPQSLSALVTGLLTELHEHAPAPTPEAPGPFLGMPLLPREVTVGGLRHPARHRTGSVALTGEVLAGLLARASQASSQGWPDAEQVPLSFVVQVHRVAGLASGVYRYGPFPTERPLRVPGSLPPTTLAPWTGRADTSALVTVLGTLPRAVGRDGAHGYRRLLLRSSAAVAEASLAAAEQGLTAYRVAGAPPEYIRQWTGIDPSTAVPLTALAVGPPLPNGESAP
ncbi:hypothetical protein [Streptomyces sp. bgisy084]|uniref:hypothetical protein n=1 Tax=Streptomyces sp. bgisy084 TaxID=3413777 RepID=UPI003D751574